MQSRAFSSCWLLLAAVAFAASAALTLALSSRPVDPQPGQPNADDWRRTASGWERRSAWQTAANPTAQPTYYVARPRASAETSDGPRYDRRPHPAAIALCELLAALAALVVWRPAVSKTISKTAGKTHCASGG